MKKFVMILFSFSLLVAIGCSNADRVSDRTAGDHVEYIQTDLQSADIIPAPGSEAPDVVTEMPPGEFLQTYWFELLLGLIVFLELIVRLTPTKRDDSILNLVLKLINAIIPNLKKTGGTFVVKTE